jgi:hypothetical protein
MGKITFTQIYNKLYRPQVRLEERRRATAALRQMTSVIKASGFTWWQKVVYALTKRIKLGIIWLKQLGVSRER